MRTTEQPSFRNLEIEAIYIPEPSGSRPRISLAIENVRFSQFLESCCFWCPKSLFTCEINLISICGTWTLSYSDTLWEGRNSEWFITNTKRLTADFCGLHFLCHRSLKLYCVLYGVYESVTERLLYVNNIIYKYEDAYGMQISENILLSPNICVGPWRFRHVF